VNVASLEKCVQRMTQPPIIPGQDSVAPAASALFRVACLTLMGGCAALTCLSLYFAHDRSPLQEPVMGMVLVNLIAGVGFLVLAREVVWKTEQAGKRALRWVLAVGFVMRVLMMFSSPMLEYDFYRYLWDGAAVSKGLNPFYFSPADIMADSPSVPPELRKLAGESGEVLPRVTHPELRTIYPPAAQAVFGIAHAIAPWSLLALRCLLAVFDAASAVMVLLTLRNLGLPLTWTAIYWCNPLVVRETFNATHMDVVALPFTLAAVMLTLRDRHVLAGITLALAVASKLWPVVLIPAILSQARARRNGVLQSIAGFFTVSVAVFLPVALSTLDRTSGFVAYGSQWQMNDSLYGVLAWGVRFLLEAASWEPISRSILTRILAALILITWIAWQCRNIPINPLQLWDRSLLIVSAVFLLSPTGFPWYFLWVAPFLAIRPRRSLLALNCLLPLYYLSFLYRAQGSPEVFNNLIRWLEYLPVLFIMVCERLGTVREGIHANPRGQGVGMD
jgi:alpha-1,6-mannosyltransferase